MRKYKKNLFSKGFTLIEIIIVVVILGIAAAVVVPTISSAADMQVRSAANRISADLDYAKGLAITHQSFYTIVFDESGESYEILDSTGSAVENPFTGQDSFVIDFSADSHLSRVDIVTADFDSNIDNAITFDYLGSPYSGTDTTTPLNSGQIALQADDFSLTVDVEPVTGYITIGP
jgi:general secretion pathway protein H